MKSAKKLLESWISEKEKKDVHKPCEPNEFYASSAGMCPRSLFLEKKHGRREPNNDLKKIFLLGNILHDFMQENVLVHGKSEEPIRIETHGIVIRGRLDFIDDESIWELKTIKDVSYVLHEPNEHHVLQLMLYLNALKRTKGKLVYMEKNSFKIAEHDVLFDETMYAKAIQGFVTAHRGILEGKSPEPYADRKTNWKCRYCQYAKECNEIADLKLFK